jgi:phosphoribosylglycinamide formyltransferase-1
VPDPIPPSAAPARLVVLASGTGSLLESLVHAAVGNYPARVVAVGLDRDCRAAQIAADAGIPTFTVRLGEHPDRAAWDAAITEATDAHAPDLIVSAGFMKILGPEFLARFSGRVVNTHPALLPAFPGAHAVPDALAYGVKVTGCTVHVVDSGVDTGPILAQEAVVVNDDDDEQTLHERIKVVERRLLVDVLATLATSGVTWSGRKAMLA